MQGVILDELEKYVTSKLGPTGLARMRNLTGRGDGGYDLSGKYPDDELLMIIRGLVEATGRPPEEIVEEFGVALVPGLLEVYGFLVDPRWSFIEFLLHTEDVIHRGVRINSANARPPELQAVRAGADSVTISYRSPRKLCALAKGIVRGAAAHYKVDITISEESCMLRGNPECLITVAKESL
ncbi:MAG TPA: heme NO-binding domain-containing protein [Methylomirabilota bacterium]|nr:heme NO-binding domain-containing protein [Methylomirabilota bacterium]